jgi:hypothetical protein
MKEEIARLIREALDRVFTVELPRDMRVQTIGKPIVSVVDSYYHPGGFYVTVQFEVK